MTLIETVADAEAFTPEDPANLAFLTQTTLSVDDTAAVAATLQRRFPGIVAPKGEDICYATSNRQASVKAIAPACDLRSEEHTSELQSLMRISYAVFCLKKKTKNKKQPSRTKV